MCFNYYLHLDIISGFVQLASAMDADASPSTPKKKRQYRNELQKEEKDIPRKPKFRDEWLQVYFKKKSIELSKFYQASVFA